MTFDNETQQKIYFAKEDARFLSEIRFAIAGYLAHSEESDTKHKLPFRAPHIDALIRAVAELEYKVSILQQGKDIEEIIKE